MRSFSTLFSLLLILLIYSCGGEKKSTNETGTEAAKTEDPAFPTDTLKGVFSGKLNDKPITLNVFYAQEGHVTGYNIVSGNRRNVSGTYTVDKNGVKLTLSEPGDDKNDGVFAIAMNRNDMSVIFGEWTSKSGEVKTVWTKRVEEGDVGLGDDFKEQYVSFFTDSVITMQFDAAGSCSYEYYRNSGQANEQYFSVNGSYESDGKTVVINWAKNDLLPKKSVFNLVKINSTEYGNDDDMGYTHELRGMGRTLTENIMP